MSDLPMSALHGRVLVSRERVKFADADPYGHLASGAYVDMLLSHRVQVLEDLLGFSIMRYAASGVGFPARRISVSYVAPAFVGEELEVGSWVADLRTTSFEVRAVVSGATDRRLRAYASLHFVTVDAKTGRSTPRPDALPVSDEIVISTLPEIEHYRMSVEGFPEPWG